MLLVSELVTNAVRHGRGDSVTVAWRDVAPGLRVEVGHSGEFIDPGKGADGGQGLFIVDAVASSWGVDAADDDVTVWFEL